MGLLRTVSSLLFLGVANSACFAEDYLCDDGAQLVAEYRRSGNFQSVVITFTVTQETMELPQVPSADGVRFSAGVNEFWIKGSEATLRRGSKVVTCKR
jgi:membrane-bound inhibitor of C-type lysozyme